MDGSKIAGILIVLALILSIAFVGYNTVTKVAEKNEKIVKTTEVLDESELNQSNTGENSSIQTVNLNIHQKVGSTRIVFSDNSSTIYNITSKNEVNKTKTTVTKQQNGSNLDVNIDSEDAQNTIILSNKYNYNITGDLVSGGFSTKLSENAKVDQLNLNITAGGVDITFNGGKLNTFNSRITTGGLNIYGEPKGETTVNSEIEVGGLNLQVNKTIADIFSEIEVGGINPGKYQKIGPNEYKGNQFDSSENKFIINTKIRVGGVNTQSF